MQLQAIFYAPYPQKAAAQAFLRTHIRLSGNRRECARRARRRRGILRIILNGKEIEHYAYRHRNCAKKATLLPITKVAERLGIQEDELEPYGRYKAKLSSALFERLADRPDGKLILVTAINPTLQEKGKRPPPLVWVKP